MAYPVIYGMNAAGTVILSSVTLTGVESISVDKTANVIPIPIATTDSTNNIVFDFLGNIRLISVSGTFQGSTSSVKVTVDSITALMNGNQGPRQFVSDQTGTINCMISDFSTNWNVPGNICGYSIKFVEGKGQLQT